MRIKRSNASSKTQDKTLSRINETMHHIKAASTKLQRAMRKRLLDTHKARLLPEAAPVDTECIERYQEQYKALDRVAYTQNALAAVPISELAQNREYLKSLNYAYSHRLAITPRVTEQSHSGRCWMFAALNSMRYELISRLNLSDSFELSEAFLFFYDKLERASSYLHRMITMRELSNLDPMVQATMQLSMQDGGTWGVFKNLIKKYGIVPKSCYGENFNSSYSDEMNEILKRKLMCFTAEIRGSAESAEVLRERVVGSYLQEVYMILSQFMGAPPETFDWAYHESAENFEAVRAKGAYHLIADLTPTTFFSQYINDIYRIDDKIVLRNDPRATSEYYRMYTGENAGYMVGGEADIAFNVPVDVMKAAAGKNIKNNMAVWFDCDVGKCLHVYDGVLAPEAFDYEGLLGVQLSLSKAAALELHLSTPSHAMALVGVDYGCEDGNAESTPVKWRVENSWGEWQWTEDSGYLHMSDKWFEQYVYDVVVDRSSVPEDLLQMYDDQEFNPVVLPWNDPFGCVATTSSS